MLIRRSLLVVAGVVCLMAGPAWCYELNGLGEAGGWDDLNKRDPTVTTVIDVSDFTEDLSASQVNAALTGAYATWGSVSTASSLAFEFKPDEVGGNYDVFDGPSDSGGPPWFDGTSATLDQDAHWRYANVVIGGWLPESYFGSPNVLAVTWLGKLSGDGSRKPAWHAEVFFNDAWNWTDDAAAADEDYANNLAGGLIDLETVALHELGHTLGLGHEDDVSSVMATYYNGTCRTLFDDDVEGITAIYSSTGKGGGKGNGKGNGKGPNKLVTDEVDWHLAGVTYVGGFSGASGTVPEPATVALLALGAVLGAVRRKARRS